jgi:hypothetical protein
VETVKVIPESDYEILRQIVDEYLPGTKLADLEKMCQQFPSAVVGYYIEDKMVGVCYGFEIDRENFTLDGIAIVQPYNALGRGGKLIALFEKCVSLLGYTNISLGSAGGYVERFYIKNGYVPVELKVYVECDKWKQKSKNYIFPVAYTQTEGERLKLVIMVTDYHAMNKTEITEYYNGRDSFFVFEKNLK